MAATFSVALVEMAGRYANLAHFAFFVLAFAGGFVGLEGRYFVGTALQAPNAIAPPGSGHVSQALFFRAEAFLNFYQAQSVASHELRVSEV